MNCPKSSSDPLPEAMTRFPLVERWRFLFLAILPSSVRSPKKLLVDGLWAERRK